MGIDASKRRLGVAGTDPERRLVTPLVTWLRRSPLDDLDRLGRLVAERHVAALVLGFPLNMDGTGGPMAKAARKLGRQLARDLDRPVLLQDERLTSFAVEAAIEEGRLPRPKPGQLLDHFAAAVLLEDALRALRRAAEPAGPGFT